MGPQIKLQFSRAQLETIHLFEGPVLQAPVIMQNVEDTAIEAQKVTFVISAVPFLAQRLT